MSTKLLLYLGFESLQPAVWSINLLLGKLSKINNVLVGKNNMFHKKSVILMTSYDDFKLEFFVVVVVFVYFVLDGSCQLCSILLPLVKFGIATVRHQEGTSQF